MARHKWLPELSQPTSVSCFRSKQFVTSSFAAWDSKIPYIVHITYLESLLDYKPSDYSRLNSNSFRLRKRHRFRISFVLASRRLTFTACRHNDGGSYLQGLARSSRILPGFRFVCSAFPKICRTVIQILCLLIDGYFICDRILIVLGWWNAIILEIVSFLASRPGTFPAYKHKDGGS